MKATHITTFKNSENIITEIIVTSQSKTRHLPTTLFHYLNPKGIGMSKEALKFFRLINRKNGNWVNANCPSHVVKTYYRNN